MNNQNVKPKIGIIRLDYGGTGRGIRQTAICTQFQRQGGPIAELQSGQGKDSTLEASAAAPNR